MRVIARQLKEARETLGLSQEQAAKAMKVSRNSVGNWERNKHTPTVWNTRRVQEMLRISLEAKNENQKD